MKLRLISLLFFLSSRVNYSIGTPSGATKLLAKSSHDQESAVHAKEKHDASIVPVMLQPRVQTVAKNATLLETLLVNPASAGQVLSTVSRIFQTELEQLQSPLNCDSITTLLCGHSSECGLTCQLHNRAACVMYSYVLKAPLIHEDRKNWPFSKPWSAAFLPLGSRCKPNNRTINVDWKDDSYMHKRRTKANKKNPLKNGLPIRKDLAKVVEKFHPSPFLWWVGQFMKYVLRLSHEQLELIHKSRLHLKKYRMKGDSAQIVGIHVRRTDKMDEVRYANHSTRYYMAAANEYFKKYFRFQSSPKSVMIATDDPSTIKEIQAKYKRPEWNVYSVNPQNSILLDSQKVRRHHLMETLKDFILLSEADYIVCGFSSNVCRLLLELKVTSQLNATDVVQSLDDGYCLGLSGVYCPEVIVKV